jgi:hypothetical protein
VTKGPHRIKLDTYLDTALGGHVQVVGRDWKRKAQDLQTLSDALKLAAGQAELRIGEQTLTGPALRAGMEKSSTSMSEKADTLRAAGEALVVVGQQINDTKDARDAMADLGPKPAAYQAPAGTPGVEPTPEELQAQAQAAQARQSERNAWQTEYDKQEARSLALTKELDAAFLGAIPPMKEIHGQDDPTEPTDDVPSGPGGPYLPGTQAPPTTGGGGGGGNKSAQGFHLDTWTEHGTEVTTTTTTTTTHPPQPITTHPITHPTNPTYPTQPITVPTISTETTTVAGSQQSGVTYQGPQVSAPASPGGAGGAGGMNAAAFGAAGAAGGASGMMGGGRAASASAGSAPTRPIGATGRSGSAGALSRTPAASSGSAAARSGTAGSPTSRGAAGPAGARGAAGSVGSAGGRGGAGSAGARGAASGSTAGSRSGRKGDRDGARKRDSLVHDQDWLGDDDVAPGVLD